MQAAEDLTKYYPKIGSKVKSIKIHDTRTLNRASAKFANPLHAEVPLTPRYTSTPVYHPKVSDPLHVEVPLNPGYSPPPVYHPKVAKPHRVKIPLNPRYTPPPVYHPHQIEKDHDTYGYKGLDEAGVTETYYGLLRSRNHFAYNSPDCLGNNYYNTTHGLNWCDYDPKYPAVQIETAIRFHFFSVASMYKDVYEEEEEDPKGEEKEPKFEDVGFENKLKTLHGKGRLKRKKIKPRNDNIHKPSKCKKLKSLCSTQGDEIIRPRRAKNTVGEWRIIVNDVTAENKAGERFYLTQTARIERCSGRGNPCPFIPEHYPSQCIQKYNVHRMLVFDPFQYYLPFAVESFVFPSSCSCYAGEWPPKDSDEEDGRCSV